MAISYHASQTWSRECTASEGLLISKPIRTTAATPSGSNSPDGVILNAATPSGSNISVNTGLSTPTGSQHLAQINIMSSDPEGVAAGVVVISPDTSDCGMVLGSERSHCHVY